MLQGRKRVFPVSRTNICNNRSRLPFHQRCQPLNLVGSAPSCKRGKRRGTSTQQQQQTKSFPIHRLVPSSSNYCTRPSMHTQSYNGREKLREDSCKCATAALDVPDGTSAKLAMGCGAWADGAAPTTRSRSVPSSAQWI